MVAKQNCYNLDLILLLFDLDKLSTVAQLRANSLLSIVLHILQVTCQTPWALYGQASRAISIG